MKRGRPRQYDPTIPSHIDQQKLPARAYWDRRDRVWYTHIEDGEKLRRRRLAGPDVTLADLHRLIEQLATPNLGSIEWLHGEFQKTDLWQKELSPATQRDYAACLKAIQKIRTRLRLSFAELQVDRLRRPDLQQLIDKIGSDRPAMAAHVRAYLGRLFAWGMQRGKIKERENPAHGLAVPKQRRAHRMPELDVMQRMIDFARARGALTAHSKGSCPPYLWIVMVIAYRCRLRGIEVLTMSQAQGLEDGIHGKRRKGSRDNVTRWSDDMREAWDAALAARAAIWTRLGRPTPLRIEDRPLLVSEDGGPVGSSTWHSAWQRFIKLAIAEGVLAPDAKFALHGLKHRGVTDTAGGKAKKQEGSGHKTAQMVDTYDHELLVVEPAGQPMT